jgi:3-hydroxyisobutyrate dehydrogenase-like beta-hydroxyacid dehydrogenase
MTFRAQMMRAQQYEPAAFRTNLMEKDLRLALVEAARLGASLPVLDTVHGAFTEVVANGDGDRDAAVVLEHLNPAKGTYSGSRGRLDRRTRQ